MLKIIKILFIAVRYVCVKLNMKTAIETVEKEIFSYVSIYAYCFITIFIT